MEVAEVELEVDAEVVEEKEEKEEKENNSDKIYQPSPGRRGIIYGKQKDFLPFDQILHR
jgi:hypothetical protein